MKKYGSLISVVLILATVYWSFSDMIPSYNKEETSSPTEFSIKNALAHLKEISKETHYVGAKEHLNVQNYIVNELKKLGLQPEVQHQVAINKKWRAATNTANIIAKIKGTTDGKALVLLTHYDSNAHSSLGASDAGSGVVTILEGLRVFLTNNKTPKNDIIVVITDAEELGLLGAKAFVDKHPFAKNIGLVLNFEARGSGGPSYMLMETNGKNSKLLTEFIKANPNYPAANSLMYSIYKMLPNDTDLTVFRENANISGFNFAFIGDHFDYHTVQDSYERLDRETLAHQADYLMTSLNYFSNADLTNLESDKDHIYTNFPIVKLLHYPFSWIGPLLIIAIVILLVTLFFGISLNKITIKGLLKGFVPFILAIILCVGVSALLWKGILLIHPQYKDILHGFTYNGYQYIAAFVFLNCWMLFKIYKPYFKKYTSTDLLIAPIVIWIIINGLIFMFLQGAGYFIIPVGFSLLILLSNVFFDFKKNTKIILFTLLSIPLIYIFSPQIKMFPVGLGLNKLFISGLFLSLMFGLIIPVFSAYKSRKILIKILGLGTLFFFAFATYNSDFNIDNRKPNSIVFLNNKDTNQSYWASYDYVLDSYTKQFLGETPIKGNPTESTSKSKYNTAFRYYKKAENKELKSSIITVVKDTIIASDRALTLNFNPQRRINKIELIANEDLELTSLGVNTVFAEKDDTSENTIRIEKGTIISYFFATSDTQLNINFSYNTSNPTPNISVVESSFDLLENPLFSVTPRAKEMMPMPFVTNDAIVTVQQLKL